MFGNKSLPSKVYLYNGRAPIENAELVAEQMHLAHRYRNALCELERNRRAEVEAAMLRHAPDLAEIEQNITDAETELEQVRTEIKRRNAEERRRTQTAADRAAVTIIRERLTNLRTHRRERRAELFNVPETVVVARREASALKFAAGKIKGKGEDKKAAVAAHKAAVTRMEALLTEWRAGNPLQAELARIDAASHERSIELRAACGLHWGTYLTVEDGCSDFRQGPPPQFKRWTGDGKLAVQLQGGLSTIDAIAGNDTRLRVEILPKNEAPRRNKRGQVIPQRNPTSNRSKRRVLAIVWMRIGSDGRSPVWAKIPVLMSRPLPDDAIIKWVYLVRRRIATHDHWSVQFVMERKEGWEKPERATEGAAGVDIGWRLFGDGSLRVAYYVGDDGDEFELRIPAKDVTRWDRADSLRSTRDLMFDEVREQLAVFLDGFTDPPEWVTKRFANLRSWKSTGRLAGVVLFWRDNRFPGDESIYATMEAWRKQDKHLYDWECHQRLKAQRFRKALYQNFVNDLRAKYKTVMVEDIDWAKMARLPKPESEDGTARRPRYLQRVAAPGLLSEMIASVVPDTVFVPPEYTTLDCRWCGHRNSFDAAKSVDQDCESCDRTFDQDENAARNILARGQVVNETAGVAR